MTSASNINCCIGEEHTQKASSFENDSFARFNGTTLKTLYGCILPWTVCSPGVFLAGGGTRPRLSSLRGHKRQVTRGQT